MKMMHRRSQITNFMILGIVLLVAIGIYFVLKYTVLEPSAGEVVPPEYVPVKNYVELCMKDLATDAVLLAGQQGGFVEVPAFVANNPPSYIEPIQGGMWKIPLWFYKGEDRVPPLSQIEYQISSYVEKNLGACLANFTQFKNDFNITSSSPAAKTTIGEDKVTVEVKLPLQITGLRDSQSGVISMFQADVDVKLRQVWELANQIMDAENSGTFLENTTIDLMSLDDKQIPLTDMQFRCGRMQWYKSNIVKEMKDVLFYNLPRIRVDNTDYAPFSESELYEKNHFLWQVTNNEYPTIKAGLMFDRDWPLIMKVRPSDGNLLKSNYGKGSQSLLSFLCINIWHFTYDVSYPVQAVLRESTSFGGGGYTFNFAFPAYIDHNQPARTVVTTRDFSVPDEGGDFCDGKTAAAYNLRAIDKTTGLDIENVNVSFECVDKLCELGKTAFDGNFYRLTTSLPSACSAGLVVMEKSGYLRAEKLVDLKAAETTIDVEMKPLKSFEYTVVKHYSTDPRWEYGLGDTQYAIITLEDEDNQYSVFDNYPKHYALFSSNITLIKDNEDYKVDIVLMDGDNYVGGYQGNWTVSYADVAGNDHLTFNIFEWLPVPDTYEKQSEMMTFLENSSHYPDYMKPVFSTEFK